MSLNVNREVEDCFYRYKMPRLMAKVEGKGNGIKTVIVNMTDIAKALYRKPVYPTKYFGCELGAQTYIDDKNDRYIVNGAHDGTKLQELLDGFIKKFVLCAGCGNPETTLSVKKRTGTVGYKCKACGHSGQLDPIHRLTQYILKNPPESEIDGGKGRKSKSGGSKSAAVPCNADNNGDSSGHGSGNDVEDGGADQSVAHLDEADDNDWGDEISDVAQAARMAELSVAAQRMAIGVELEKTQNERIDDFYNVSRALFVDGTIVSKVQQLKQKAEDLNLREGVVMMLMEIILCDEKTIVADINKYKFLFQAFSRLRGPKAQNYVLHGMEKLIEKFSKSGILQKSCHILKALYDTDIVTEESIIEWYDRGPSKKHVTKELSKSILQKCEQMVNWLKSADEESEDDEEEAEEESTEESQPTQIAATNHKAEPVVEKKKAEDGSDDEIDIDDI